MALTTISPNDYELIRALRIAGVLKDLDNKEFEPKSPSTHDCVVAIMCADGHRFDDKYQHTKCACGANLHPLTRHGGALTLAANSPFSKQQRKGEQFRPDLCLLAEIEEAMSIKSTSQIVSFAHFPCAKATGAGLHADDVLMLHIEAKERIREEFPQADVRCLVHVDYNGWSGHNRFATYFLDRSAMSAWIRDSPEAKRYPGLVALAA